MGSERDADEALQLLLDRLQAGDPAASEEILTRAMDRFRRLAGKMLAKDARLHRWEDTDDLLQNAALRLYRALQKVHPETPQALFGLAALQIRRELVDLGRHHFGAKGEAAHHASDPGPRDGSRQPLDNVDGEDTGPSTVLQWQEFHTQVQGLPDDEREVFDLIFYQGLEQQNVARLLKISVETVKRRWRSARLLLAETFQACPPLD